MTWSACAPFDHDPDPSPIGQSLAARSPGRPASAARRCARAISKADPARRREKRGARAFVEVSWDEALDLVARELDARERDHSATSAIFAGSYGWSSAGRFHHAQSQVHRFMNAIGGYVAHVGTYSLGAARTLLPHILMDMDAMRAQHTAWVELEKHCELLVAFGGIPCEERAGEQRRREPARGASRRSSGSWRPACSSSTSRRCATTSTRRAPSGSRSRPNTDAAFMLALAHTLDRREPARRALSSNATAPASTRFRRYVMGETDGQPKTAEWAAAICDVPAATIVSSARRMAAKRTMINVAWSLQRGDHGEQPYWLGITLACLLGQIGTPGGGFALGYGSGQRRRRERAAVLGTGAAAGQEPGEDADSRRAHHRHAREPRRALRLQRQGAAPIPTSASSTGRAAIRSIITRT